MAEPRWLTAARAGVGQREIRGRRHNPKILQWWTLIRAGFTDDETPWCAGFVGGMLESVGIRSSRSAAARSYEKWGRRLNQPIIGCIVTFRRRGGGHVGFYVGETGTHILVLGGNQSNVVSIARFSKSSRSLVFTGYWWPKNEPLLNGRPRKENVVEGGAVTLIGQPDDPGVELGADDVGGEATTLTGKVKHWANVIATSGGAIFAGLFDWRVALVICVFGFFVFCIIWFTHMRRK